MGDGQILNGRGIAIISVSVILSIFAVGAVVLRYIARTYKGYRYFYDDYLIIAALILTLGVTIDNIVGVFVAGIGDHEDLRTDGPAKGFPVAKDLLAQGKVMFALQILHTCAMPLIKASILAFYVRLFPCPRFKRAVYAVSAYVLCWWISTLFVTIFQCKPIADNWGTDPSQLNSCIANVNGFYEAAALLNVLGDILVLCLPIPVVAGLHMSTKNRIAVLGIFLTGALVTVAGIGRTVAYFNDDYNDNPDFSYWYYSLVIWTSAEPTLGVISACLPTLRPLFAGMSPESLMGSIRSALSLHSLRGGSPVAGGTPIPDDRQHLSPTAAAAGGSTVRTRSQGAFFRLPDPNGSSKENQDVALELQERKLMQKDMPAKGIVVQEDLDQKVVHTVHETV